MERRDIDVLDTTILLNSIYNFYSLEEYERRLKNICHQIGVEGLYNNLRNSLDSNIFNLLLNPLSEEYQNLLSNNLILGKDYIERSNYFLNWLSNKDQLNCFFLKYPVLKYKIDIKIDKFFNFNFEILESISKDRVKIQNKMNIKKFCVKSISETEGDTHNGKSVRLVEFEHGEKIVFKPRSLKTDNIIYSVMNFICSKNEGLSCYIPWGIDCDLYSWQEYIEDTPFNSEKSVSEFYYKSGVYLAIFLLFGTCDLHYENIHVKSNSPVFIDLEVLGMGEASQNFSSFTFNLPQTSVLNSYLLPIPSKKEIMQFNVSGLFPDTTNSKTVTINKFELNETNEWKFIQQDVKAESVVEKLTYQGKRILPEQVELDIKAGFSIGLKTILDNKLELQELLTFLFKESVKIRQILRPTMVYSEFLTASNYQKYLKSFKYRNLLFNILLENFEPGNIGYYRVQDEIRQLENEDIPSFYMYSDSQNLYNDKLVLVEKYYAKNYFEALLERLNLLTYSDLDKQIRYINLSLSAYYAPVEYFQPIIKHSKALRDVKDIEKEYLEYITASVVESPEKQLELYSLQINSFANKEMMYIEGLESGLYLSGGIILSLMELSDGMGERLGKELYNTISHKTIAMLKSFKYKVNIGVFTGVGGLLYLSYYLYNKLGDSKYVNTFIEIQQLIKQCLQNNSTDAINDFIAGVAGVLTLLCNIGQKNRNYIDEELVDLLQNSLNNNCTSNDDISFSHGELGRCAALISLYAFNSSENVLNHIDDKINIVKANISQFQDNQSWCRGYIGYYLLLYKMCEQKLDLDGKFDLELEKLTISDIDKLLNLKNESLCHGISGNILILKKISKFLSSDVREYCYKYVFNSLSDPFAIRWTRGSDYLLESFMIGISGTLYALKLVEKDNFPLILLLEI